MIAEQEDEQLTPKRSTPTIHYWLPLLIWIGAILSVSSVPGPTLDKVGFSIQDGLAHGLEYAVLGFLAYRRQVLQRRSGIATAMLASCLLAAVVGAVDETYQLLIPGRVTDPSDWIADVSGAAVGGAVASIYYALSGRRRRSLESLRPQGRLADPAPGTEEEA
jgi:VanZ family protein